MKEWIPGIFYDPLSIDEKLMNGTNRKRKFAILSFNFPLTINRRIPEAWIRDRRWMVRTEVEEQPGHKV